MSIQVVSVPSVRKEAIEQLLGSLRQSLATTAHVTATASLEIALRNEGWTTVSVVNLIDLVVDAHFELTGSMPEYPAWDEDPQRVEGKIGDWRSARKGPLVERTITFDDRLRSILADDLAAGRAEAAVLLRSRRAFRETVESLAAAGVEPAHVKGEGALTQIAASAWKGLDRDLPHLGTYRRVLWGSEFHADKALSVMQHALGLSPSRRTILYHGFHFFTPPQWAIAQRIEENDLADQVFVIHQIGQEPAFEVWRHFFGGRWKLPAPEVIDLPEPAARPPAEALRAAMTGKRVNPDHVDGIQIKKCASPAALVQLWNDEAVEGKRTPLRFAAAARTLEQFQLRLSDDMHERQFDLAELPVGVYILALHRCMKSDAGQPRIEFDAQSILDILASGYLQVDGQQVEHLVPLVERVLPYFHGCRSGVDWQSRAAAFEAVVAQEVAPRGARSPGESDAARMQAASENLLRLVPWVDISESDARTIRLIVESIVRRVKVLAEEERRTLSAHWSSVRAQLEQGMRALAPEEAMQIESRLGGFFLIQNEPLHIAGLVDAVSMLLGRDVVSPVSSEDEDGGSVKGLHALDALGFAPTDQGVHVANFADGLVPRRAPNIGWPFRLEDLDGAPAASTEILATRVATAALSDLYLFWLALNGVEDGGLTFSWIAERSGELYGPSPLLALISELSIRGTRLQDRLGGIPVRNFSGADRVRGTTAPVEPDTGKEDGDVRVASDQIAAPAVGAAVACPRRFALQWALGPSHAFASAHHWSMLYGNVRGGFARSEPNASADEIKDVCDEVWTPLSEGEKAASFARRVVAPETGRGARPQWAFMLSGSSRPDASGVMDLAYKAVIEPHAEVEIASSDDAARFLPAGVADAAICEHCPVREACRDVRRSDD